MEPHNFLLIALAVGMVGVNALIRLRPDRPRRATYTERVLKSVFGASPVFPKAGRC